MKMVLPAPYEDLHRDVEHQSQVDDVDDDYA